MKQLQFLQHLNNQYDKYRSKLWRTPNLLNDPVEILIDLPENKQIWEKLEALNLDAKLLIPNVES